MTWTEQNPTDDETKFYAYFSHTNGVQVQVTIAGPNLPDMSPVGQGSEAMEDVVAALDAVPELTRLSAQREYRPRVATLS